MEHREIVPPYTPSTPSPSYSIEVMPGEQTIAQTRIATSGTDLIGVYRKITHNITIVLRDQRPGGIHPTYGQRVIRGELLLTNIDDLTSVVLKLEGMLRVDSIGASVTTNLFSDSYPMWSAMAGQDCPRSVPFTLLFPSTFEDGSRSRPLPPTFETSQHTSEPRAVCSYSLTVELNRPTRLLSFMKTSNPIKVPLVYNPRCRPHMPILRSDSPFTVTVKSCPEEWHQILCIMDTIEPSSSAPVQCLLFIPSARVFAFSDVIPFHLQIRGPSPFLIPFIVQGEVGGSSRQPRAGMAIRVYLLRQTGFSIHGRPIASSHVLGEGTLERSQSLSTGGAFHPLGDDPNCLDWDGEVRCREDVVVDAVASFFTSQLYVQDFVVLSVIPRDPSSPLAPVKHCYPIRLVTDPWSDQAVSW